MQAFIINIIVTLVQRLLEKEIWNDLRELIMQAEEMFSDGTPGDQKRAWVLEQLATGSSWLVNLALEVIVAQKRV